MINKERNMGALDTIKSQFNYDSSIKLPRRFLSDEYIFSLNKSSMGKEYDLVHSELSLVEHPLAVEKEFFIAPKEQCTKNDKSCGPITMRIILAIKDPKAVVDFLFDGINDFERPLSIDTITNSTETYHFGETGLSWSWEKHGLHYISFIRHNVFISLQGKNEEILSILGKEVDAVLEKSNTIKTYPVNLDDREMYVEVGGRIDFKGKQENKETFFFLSNYGSVNRDKDTPSTWYYRAGMKKQTDDVLLIRVGDGIVPTLEQFTIHIT